MTPNRSRRPGPSWADCSRTARRRLGFARRKTLFAGLLIASVVSFGLVYLSPARAGQGVTLGDDIVMRVLEMTGCGLAALIGIFGLIFSPSRRTAAEPDDELEPFVPEVDADELDSLRQQLPPVYTLVTVSDMPARSSSRFNAPGEIVLSAGDAAQLSASDAKTAARSATIASDIFATNAAMLRTEIDPVLMERLDEFSAGQPQLGCALLISETTVPAPGAPRLNGAAAAMSLARTLAKAEGLSTLLIDAGSPAWSTGRGSTADGADDVMLLPSAAGVYDILAGEIPSGDWILLEDDQSGLTALSPGTSIPHDWSDKLRSTSMRRLIARAKKMAQLVIVYGPRSSEHPEVVRTLGQWTDALLLVGGADARADEAEMLSLSMLRGSRVLVLGRITLVTQQDLTPAPITDHHTNGSATLVPGGSVADKPLPAPSL